MKNPKGITLRELLAMFCADVDIFLLQDEAQENDLDKVYTKEEIRQQLHKTMDKFTSLPVTPGVYDIELFPPLIDVVMKDMGFSKKEIEDAKKNALR